MSAFHAELQTHTVSMQVSRSSAAYHSYAPHCNQPNINRAGHLVTHVFACMQAFTRKCWRAWRAAMTQRHVRVYKCALAEHFQRMRLLKSGFRALQAALSYR